MDRNDTALAILHRNFLDPDYEYYTTTVYENLDEIEDCVCGHTINPNEDWHINMSGQLCCGDEDCAWKIFRNDYQFDLETERTSEHHCLCGNLLDETKKPYVVANIKYCTDKCFWDFLKQEYKIKEVDHD